MVSTIFFYFSLESCQLLFLFFRSVSFVMMLDPFLVTINMTGEGTVDLNVRFIFSLPSLSGLIWLTIPMEISPWSQYRRLHQTEWKRFLLALWGGARIGKFFSLSRKYVSHVRSGFQRYGVQTPFFRLSSECAPMDETVPFPTAPELLCLYEGFELVYQHLQITPSKNVFSTLFTVQRGMEKGGGQGWVSLRHNKKKLKSFGKHSHLLGFWIFFRTSRRRLVFRFISFESF